MKARGKILLTAVLFCAAIGFPIPSQAQTLHDVLQRQSGIAIEQQATIPSVADGKSEMELREVRSLQGQIESISKNSPSELGEFLTPVDNMKLNENSEEAKGTLDLDRLRELLESSTEIQKACRRIKEATEAARVKAAEEARRADIGNRLVAASYSTPSPGAGLCAAWVSYVHNNAGFGYPGGNADDMYYRYCTSNNRADIRQGMIIATPSHPHTYLGGIYGHVGLIIKHQDGSWWVRQNVGAITEQPLEEWISYYGATHEVRWGWIVP